MLILASQSPRRRDILTEMGVGFTVSPSGYEEDNARHIPPEELARLQAEGKARDVWERSGKKDPVLGADTIVVLDGRVMGKPRDEKEADEMLASLSGRAHQVMTGVALIAEGNMTSGVCVTDVLFREMTAEERADYIATGEPMDKAGAYAVQGIGGKFVKEVRGSLTNVIGLPKEMTGEFLKAAGII